MAASCGQVPISNSSTFEAPHHTAPHSSMRCPSEHHSILHHPTPPHPPQTPPTPTPPLPTPPHPSGPGIAFLLCILPILFLVTVTVWKRVALPTRTSLPLAAAMLGFIRLSYFSEAPQLVASCTVSGLLEALTPLTIIGGAILLFQSMEATRVGVWMCLRF